jgi:hypothetical protein
MKGEAYIGGGGAEERGQHGGQEGDELRPEGAADATAGEVHKRHLMCMITYHYHIIIIQYNIINCLRRRGARTAPDVYYIISHHIT